MPQPDIVVLGSLNMDLVVRTERMPRPGETLRGLEFRTIPGGKGANQAAAAARLGARVEMVGRVGADAFGPALLDNLRAQGVGAAGVTQDPDTSTGTATIIVEDDGRNTIIVVPGANGRLTQREVDAAAALLSPGAYLVLQFEVPLPMVRAAIERAAAVGARVIVNAAPSAPVEPGFFQGVYALVVNEQEAAELTGASTDEMAGVREAAGRLLAMGPAVAIVTLGAQGALLAGAEGMTHVPARAVRVVDTTAAGDAFVGGLTVALLRGLPLAEAVRYATCAGTLATTVLGAQTSLPTAAAVDAFYRESAP